MSRGFLIKYKKRVGVNKNDTIDTNQILEINSKENQIRVNKSNKMKLARNKMKRCRKGKRRRKIVPDCLIFSIPRLGDYSSVMRIKYPVDSSTGLFNNEFINLYLICPRFCDLFERWIKFRMRDFVMTKNRKCYYLQDSGRSNMYELPKILKTLLIFGIPRYKITKRLVFKKEYNQLELNKLFVNMCLNWGEFIIKNMFKTNNIKNIGLIKVFEYFDDEKFIFSEVNLDKTNKLINEIISKYGGRTRVFNPEYFLNVKTFLSKK